MDGIDQRRHGAIAAQSMVLLIHGIDILKAVQSYPATLLIVIIGLHDAVTEEGLDPQLYRLLPCVCLLFSYTFYTFSLFFDYYMDVLLLLQILCTHL